MSGRRFTLIRRLGEGAFGAVYLADYETSGGFRKRCAIKLLHPTWDPESDAVARLRDEARLLGRLQHPNIVRVDDLLQLNGRWGVVMEAIRGENLEQLILRRGDANAKIPLSVVTATLAGMVAAIRAAAGLRDDGGRPTPVVHRDIKPSNVLMSDGGSVRVLDFGVAQGTFEGREARTGQMVFGSLGYMAPERFLGEPEGTTSDLYATAVTGFELLLLRTLGRCPLKPAVHDRELDRVRDEVATRYGDSSTELRDLLRAMVRFDAEGRPDVDTVHQRLSALVRSTSGPDMETWAAENLKIDAWTSPDPIAGTVLAEDVVPPRFGESTSDPPSGSFRAVDEPTTDAPSAKSGQIRPSTEPPPDEPPVLPVVEPAASDSGTGDPVPNAAGVEPVPAVDSVAPPTTPEAEPSLLAASPTGFEPEPPAGTNWARLGLAAAVVLALGGLGYLLFPGEPPEEPVAVTQPAPAPVVTPPPVAAPTPPVAPTVAPESTPPPPTSVTPPVPSTRSPSSATSRPRTQTPAAPVVAEPPPAEVVEIGRAHV
mgnify:CR=1 FL=1